MGGSGFKRNRGKTPIINAKSLKRAQVQGHDHGKKRTQVLEEEIRDNGESLVTPELDETKLDESRQVVETEDVEEDTEVAAGGPTSAISGGKGRKVVIVLEEACLEVVKSKSGKFELLN